MKVTIEIDISPEEARRFLGLPNVEKFQEQWLKNAENYLTEAGQSQMAEFISSAAQPMMAYQNWLQNMLTGNLGEGGRSAKSGTRPKKAT